MISNRRIAIVLSFVALLLWQANSDADTDSSRQSRRRDRRSNRRIQQGRLIDGGVLEKYVTELYIPPVLHDDLGKNANFEISLRQFEQQILPVGYPKTTIWGFGDPSQPQSFHHPSGSVEVTRNKQTHVTWRNELLVDPDACRLNGFSASNPGCAYLSHILQDYNGTPVIDQTLHWAAPNQVCASGASKTDCEGASTEPYLGPVPMVPHVHGSHVESRSDGYPESWFLPKASNIPAGYATEGTFFRTRYLPSQGVPDEGNKYVTDPSAGDAFFQPAVAQARGQGYAVFRYTNDQDTTSLWYHDHSLGLTRLNVYAGGAGFWFIRNTVDGENLLAPNGADKKPQSLPGPPPRVGQDPNNPTARKQIREIPIVIQDMSFYNDGRLFYASNRAYFDRPDCNDGGDYEGDNIQFPYKPASDVSPTWNPESFFDTAVVNGNTFPKFTVAPERYRLRLLNACDSRTLNLSFRKGSLNGTDLPFFVIGSDQGMLPKVVKIRTGYATFITPGQPATTAETPAFNPFAALLMGPAERYDVIVDFAGLPNGAEVYVHNTGPDFPYGGFDEDGFAEADENKVGQIMKFVIDKSLRKAHRDSSTSPYDLVLKSTATPSPTAKPSKKPGSAPSTGPLVRDLSVFELDSDVCILPASPDDSCKVTVVNCTDGDIDPLTGYSSLSYGPIQSRLGHDGRLGPGKLVTQRWSNPINQNPALGDTEIWEFWNWTQDGHPLHVHLVSFKILGRYNMNGKKIYGPYPFETGKKDTVVSLPGIVTKIQLSFDIAGLYVWHCHILSHEDNEMMLPFCVGRKGVDCPASLF